MAMRGSEHAPAEQEAARSSMSASGKTSDLARRIEERARSSGFALVGIARHRPTEHMPFYREWVERGLHGDMAYLAREDSIARRADLGATLESVRSVVVVADEYHPDDARDRTEDPSRGIIARYARGADYHRVVAKKLRALLRWIDDEVGGGVSGRAYVDTGPILERDLARRAGLGWYGRNTMLINPRRGSYFFIGLLLLDVELAPSRSFDDDRCGSCRACLDACPTGALLGRDDAGAPVIDARRCISYLTIELRGPIPREQRPLMGNRVFGCDICQEVCPWNRRFADQTAEPRYAARGPGEPPSGVEPLASDVRHPGTDSPPLVDLMSMDEAAWESFSRGSALRRSGRSGFLRNVAVALGNWASPEAVPVLVSALEDSEPLVRGHAAWALGRIGSAPARAALTSALASEDDPFVREELESALGG